MNCCRCSRKNKKYLPLQKKAAAGCLFRAAAFASEKLT
jgi:hypothetical protein